jgi:threonine synthase
MTLPEGSLAVAPPAPLSARPLRCRNCGAEYPPAPTAVCGQCVGPLDPVYDPARALPARDTIAARPPSLWRYREWLPFEGTPTLSLDTGYTPLVEAPALARRLGVARAWIKNDTVSHPSLSFKDRVVAVAINAAAALGLDTIGCASTGNLANAVAAHAARAGLAAWIFIPEELETGKVVGTNVYGSHLVRVRGTYDDVNRLCLEIGEEHHWAIANVNLRPYYSEGAKTLAFEVAEQLGWQAPDRVVVPVGSGNMFVKIHKGFEEFQALGLIPSKTVRMTAAQAEGCGPIATAYRNNTEAVTPVTPHTVAKSLAIGSPADGGYVLDLARRTGGEVEAVTDAEAVEAIRLLAETEGLFTEPAGGVTIGVLKKLAAAGAIGADEVTVAYITGIGLKALEAVENVIETAITIRPTLASFEESVLARV